MKLKQYISLKNIELLLLAALILAIPFEKQHIFLQSPYFSSISLYLSDILAVILMFLWLFSTSNNVNNKISKWVFGLFMLISAISWIFSPRETVNSYLYLKVLVFSTLFYNLALKLHVERLKAILLNSLVVSGLLQAIIAITQFITQKSLGLKILGEPTISPFINGVAKIDLIGEKAIRAYGTFAHPNQLAAFLFVACATCVWLYLKSETNKQKFLYLVALSVLIIGEFVAFSRIGIFTTYIFFVAALLTVYSEEIKTRLNHFKPLLKNIFVVTIFSVIVFWPYLQSRAEQKTPETYNRTLYNQTGVEIFKDHPVTGVGIGESRFEMSKRIPHEEEWQVQVPHNFFIIVSSETGAIGLFGFIAIFVFLIKKLIEKIKQGGGLYIYILLYTLIGVIILMQFDHYFYTLQQTQLLFFLLIAMITAEIAPKPQENEQYV